MWPVIAAAASKGGMSLLNNLMESGKTYSTGNDSRRQQFFQQMLNSLTSTQPAGSQDIMNLLKYLKG